MTLSQFLLVAFAAFLAGLFVWKAYQKDAISWLNLFLITVLGGWCALLVWHHSSISSSISTYELSVKLLSDKRHFENDPEIKGIFQSNVDNHPSELSRLLMDHYRIFTGYGWAISLSYFAALSATFGIFKLITRQKTQESKPEEIQKT